MFENAKTIISKPVSRHSIIAVVNQKGGCGKTTTTINLASGLAKKGFKVLIVDLDPQAHATLGIGVQVQHLAFSLYDVLVNGLDIERAIMATYLENLEIVPATSMLTGAQLEIADVLGREGLLKARLNRMRHTQKRHYDYILFDCSPSLNLLTMNALVAARTVLIPIQAHYFSLEGMKELLLTINAVQERLNSQLEILGILVTLFDGKTNLSKQILEQIKEYFKDRVLKTMIHVNIKLMEATAHGKSVLDYDPRSRGAQEYSALTEEVLTLTQPDRVPEEGPGHMFVQV